MNILDLEIGDTGIAEDGIEYRVIGDTKECVAFFGVIPVRIAKDQHGKTHKFIRGIEVKLLHVGGTGASVGGGQVT